MMVRCMAIGSKKHARFNPSGKATGPRFRPQIQAPDSEGWKISLADAYNPATAAIHTFNEGIVTAHHILLDPDGFCP